MSAFWANLRAAKTWKEVRNLVVALYDSADFEALEHDEVSAFRARIWEHVAGRPEIVVDPMDNASAYILWIETQTDPDEVKAAFKMLKRSPNLARLTLEQLRTLEARTAAVVARVTS